MPFVTSELETWKFRPRNIQTLDLQTTAVMSEQIISLTIT